jgi:2,4-dienoyl-CoA reductase-like NADH-dependent reductase (Old Yellow Enzyme family)
MTTTTASTSVLAKPLALPCGAVLPNRIAKSAMSEQLATRDGRPTPKLHRLYATWAQGGAGLLITGNVMIDRRALTEPGNVILDDDRATEAYRAWAGAAHAHGAKIWMQINHPGRVATVPFNRRPVAPSASREPVPGYNLRKPRELTGQQIQQLIAAYASTAARGVAAGFDGIQIHAAHGYLLSQFLSPLANQRTDEYGGDPQRRRRTLLEVVAAVRAAVGASVAISVKLNSKDFQHGGFDETESLDVACALADAGIDLLEISGGNYVAPAMQGVEHTNRDSTRGYFADYATRVRDRVSVPLMLTGGLRSADAMHTMISDETVDVIGLARPLCFVPDYPARILAGETEPDLPRNPPQTGYQPADGYLQLALHNVQLHRIASGRTPQATPGTRTILTALARAGSGAAKQVVVPG